MMLIELSFRFSGWCSNGVSLMMLIMLLFFMVIDLVIVVVWCVWLRSCIVIIVILFCMWMLFLDWLLVKVIGLFYLMGC